MTNKPNLKLRSARTAWETAYPCLFGLFTCVIWYMIGAHVISMCDTHKWHLDQLYAAVFGFLSITTGFLATFYGTVQSTSDGFIKLIKDTRIMSKFLRFTKGAIVTGFVVSILTIPMLVTTPLPRDKMSASYWLMTIWLGLSVYAVCKFFRVASNLFFLFETQAPAWRTGG